MSRKDEIVGKHAKHTASDDAPTVGNAASNSAQPGAFSPAAGAFGVDTSAYHDAAAYSAAAAKNKKGGKLAVKVATIVVGALLAVYLIGVGVFSNMFYPNTTFEGNDISFKNATYLSGLISDVADDYVLQVSGDGVDFTVTSNEAGLTIDADSAAEQALADNNAFAWPIEVFRSHNVSANLQASYNESGLQQVVAAQVETFNATATDPTNASIAYSSDVGAFQVTEAQVGTKLDADAVTTVVEAGVSGMEAEVELTSAELLQPTVTSDNEQLQQAAATANSYLGADIELVLGTTAIHAADVGANEISQWVTVGDDLSVTFDSDAMTAWVKNLAASIDTVGTSRTFNSTTDGTITVSGGTYGWTVDEDQLVSDVEEAVTSGTVGQLTVPTNGEGYTWAGQGVADWGAYAEIDISEQHAWFYDANGVLQWESDVVTGKPGYDTPTGVWKILNKATDYTLTGDISVATGQPEYRTKVAYWMPFTYDGCGFHDATWQSAFGGTRYLDGYGSHGCANLPLSAAASLYQLIQTGNAVIVHE